MTDKEFDAFIDSTDSCKSVAKYNLATQNCTKKAITAFKDAGYNKLAKAHISNAIVQAYHNNAAFKAKLQEVCDKCNVVIVE